MTAGAPPAAVTIQRIEDELGWTIIQIYGLTETAPAISICEPRPEHRRCSADERARIKARQGVELITSGELRVVDDQGREVPADGTTPGEIIARGNVIMAGLLQRSRGDREVHGRRLVSHRRRRGRASRRLRADHRSPEGRHHQRRREHFVGRSRGDAAAPRRHPGSRRRRRAAREVGRGAARVRGVQGRPVGDGRSAARVLPRATWRTSRCRTASRRSRSCRRRRPGRFRSSCCARAAPTSRRNSTCLFTPPPPITRSNA